MSETFYIREGSVTTVQMQLLSNGSGISISGCNGIEIRLLDAKGKSYKYSSLDAISSVAIINSGTGIVAFTDISGIIFSYARQPYNIYWWVYPVSGNSSTKFSVPSDDSAIIKVLKDY